MEEGSVTKVLNDFLTVSEGEIAVKKGDIVQVLKKVDRHWWYGCCSGKYGNIPGSYLMAIEVPPIEDGHELFAAVADFPRQQDGDLSFRKGELIVGVSQVSEDWWYGRIDARSGMFPTTYVWQLDSKLLKDKSKYQGMNMKVCVKMNMKAQLDEEMDLYVGEIVTVTEIVEKDWYRGICGTRAGIFPSAYVEILHDNDTLKGNETSHRSDLKLPVQVPASSHHAAKLDSKDDIDSLLALSPEAQFPPSTQSTDTHTMNSSNIFDDDYFKVNMPSLYHSESEIKLNTTESYNAQPLLELDVVPYGITLYPFFAQFDNELSFHEGEIVTLCRHIDKDWIEGKIDGKKGIFPKSYVNILVDCEDYKSAMGDTSHNPLNESQQLPPCYLNVETELTPKMFAKVLYNFDAQMNGDLSVHKDEVVWVVSKANEDWCEVRNQSGTIGLCPQNYLIPHLLQNESSKKLLRGTSLATDNLLCIFSSAENNDNKNFVDIHYLSSDGSKRNYQNNDFVLPGSMCSQQKCSIDDLISKNVETYHVSAQTARFQPSHRHSLILSEERNAAFMSGNANRCVLRHQLSVSPKLPAEDSLGGIEQIESNSENMQTHHLSSSQYPEDGKVNSASVQTCHSLPSQRPEDAEVNSEPVQTHHSSPSQYPEDAEVTSAPVQTHHSSPSQYPEDGKVNCAPVQTHHSSPSQYPEDDKVNSEPVQTHHSSPSQYPKDAEKKPIHEQNNEETCCEEGDIELRHHHNKTPSHVSRSRFQRHDLSRRSSDRLPHRPAPPVPVPGQRPVRRSLLRAQKHITELPEHTPAKENTAPAGQHLGGENDRDDFEAQRRKDMEQRQNVITELVMTEKEYVRDLNVTYETFNLYNPRPLEARGIDVKVVFGNILEVMQLAEDLLDKLQLAMKGKPEDEQCVGPCFLEVADQMKCVYGQYCMNHNNALTLLEKYESIEEIQSLFNKGLETIRLQVVCFDMGSILIKPVQRILKYPLILNELIKCTEDSHMDKPELLNAVRTMMGVATYINEYKRRKDIVSKYLDDGNTTISSRMSRISLHSVAKKSTRLGVMLTSTLFGVATKDPVFNEHETVFHAVEKTVRSYLKDIDVFMSGVHETMSYQLNIGVSIDQFYQESNSEAKDYHHVQQLICRKFIAEFKKIVEQRVLVPLNMLLELFEGPAILVQKRHDKLLDYDGSWAKAEKNKDNRLIQEELLATKSNYEALNSHLLDELPTLNSLACEVFVECLTAFVMARKMLSGKITKEYLALMETPFMKSAQGDAVESFAVRHSLVWNQLGRFIFSQKSGKTDTLSKRNSKASPTPITRQFATDAENRRSLCQSSSQQAFLQSHYSRDMLYCVVKSYVITEAMELAVERGNIVGVIKKHNPLGDKRMWFVDDGLTKGFVPKCCLEPLYEHVHSGSPSNMPPQELLQNNSQKKIKAGPSPPTAKLLEPPPPSYDEVVSSAESSPRLERSRSSAASEHEYHIVSECEVDGHTYEEIPESDVSTVYENVPSNGDRNITGFFYAAYDFEGNGMHMLSVKSGQVVLVLQQHDVQGNPEWWLVEDRFGGQGYVPGNYLRRYEQ